MCWASLGEAFLKVKGCKESEEKWKEKYPTFKDSSHPEMKVVPLKK
jgi:hypothetical protein